MRALKSIFALLLLGTWFPCTVHCALEMATADHPLLVAASQQVANHSHSTPADSDHCVCGCMKAGGYTFQKCGLFPVPPITAFVLFTLPALGAESLTHPGLPQEILSPPELSSDWQFVQRTASSPRAPASIS